MTTEIRQQAEEAAKLVDELNAIVLPEPSADLVPLPAADAPTAEEIRKRVAEIDMTDTNSIVSFGSAAQAELQQISQSMLRGVKNKDVGPAGDSLREIVGTIRGFSVDELDPNRKQSWWERLFGKAKPIHNFIAKYEEVQDQIDRITENLLKHEHTLMKDIKSLDLLYEKTLDFYHELALYIAAGEEKLRELDAETIPAKEAEVQAAPEDDQVLKAQELRDLRAARDDLERRVHDLKLTRQVTMQSLPSIRLVQENDKSLVTKINSTLVNTVPLWETQLAQAVTIQRSTEAAKAVREATDLTNELLTQNAANLRESNRIVREEMERGVFDIEAVKQANAELIATIEESLQIADEGKRRRAEAEAEMQRMETELRDTLSAASSRASGAAGAATGSGATPPPPPAG
ncbi:toxic anion resistance protein [Roseicyclus sp.]